MMGIWHKAPPTIEQLNQLGTGTMGNHLGMLFTAVGDEYLQATMPVDERTRQPYGLLHGGASVALAETLGSVASAFVVNPDRFRCVGIEINANHVRAVRSGLVTGVATPLHIGATTHVWDIKIYNDNRQLVCVSRLTVAIVPAGRV